MTKNSNHSEISDAIREILDSIESDVLQLKKDIVQNPLTSQDKINELAELIKFINSTQNKI